MLASAPIVRFHVLGRLTLPFSLNIFKIYQEIGRHIDRHPESRDLFPNYFSERKPLVLKGPAGPLSGQVHNAAYFHGR